MACAGLLLPRGCLPSADSSLGGWCSRPRQGTPAATCRARQGTPAAASRARQGTPAATSRPRQGAPAPSTLSCRGSLKRQWLGEDGRWRRTYQLLAAGPNAQTGVRRTAVASAAPQASGPMPPTTREEAIQQAGASLSTLLSVKGGGRPGKKGFYGGAKGAPRYRVELPLEDEKDEAVASLALDLLRATKGLPAQGVVLCFPEAPLENAAKRLLEKAPILGVAAAVCVSAAKQSLVDSSLAVFVGMRDSDVPAIQVAMSALGPRPAIAVNPEWEDDGSAGSPGALMKSFQVAYSYLPLRIQGFFTNTEGAVLLTATESALAATPWGIYVKDKGQFKCLLRLKKRPTQTDIEQVFYMVAAENSPVTKAISWTKSLTGSK